MKPQHDELREEAMRRALRLAAILTIYLQPSPVCAEGPSFESFLEPFRRIDLAPAESGLVDEVLIREGDRVALGQVLASLDKDVFLVGREIAAAAAAAEGRRDAAAAEVRLREVRLKKLRELRVQGHASHDELERAEAELAAAQANMRTVKEQEIIDRLEVRKADALIERRLIRSPIDGVVTRVHREEGEYVTPVAPTVVTVTQLDPLRAVFNLPFDTSKELRAETPVEIDLPDVGTRVTGRIEFVSPVIDADSGTVRVKVLVKNPDGTVPSGVRCFLVIPPSGTDPLTNPKDSEPNVVGLR